MGRSSFSTGHFEVKSIDLPAPVFDMLTAEAKRSRKSIAEYMAQWLEDQADGREAARRMKLLREGKTQAIPAEQVYSLLGI